MATAVTVYGMIGCDSRAAGEESEPSEKEVAGEGDDDHTSSHSHRERKREKGQFTAISAGKTTKRHMQVYKTHQMYPMKDVREQDSRRGDTAGAARPHSTGGRFLSELV